ncbi:MAG: hypothetical protein ACXWUU_02690 [Burkholderiales bacterium]
MRPLFLFALLLSLPAATAIAADPGARTYADPECSSRTADPAKCVILDGPRPGGSTTETTTTPEPTPTPPASGSSFTQPSKGAPQPAPKAGTSFTAPKAK